MLLLKVKIQSWSQGEAIPLEAFALRHLRARKHFSTDKQATATRRPEEKRDHHLKNKVAATLKIDLNQHYTTLNWNPPSARDCRDLEMHKCRLPCNPCQGREVLISPHSLSMHQQQQPWYVSKCLSSQEGGVDMWESSREGMAAQRASSGKRRQAKDENPKTYLDHWSPLQPESGLLHLEYHKAEEKYTAFDIEYKLILSLTVATYVKSGNNKKQTTKISKVDLKAAGTSTKETYNMTVFSLAKSITWNII